MLFPALLNAGSQFVNWAVTFSFIPILAGNMGASDIEVGLLMTVFMAVNLVGLSATAAFVNRLGARNLVRTGFLLLGMATLLAAWSPTVWWLFLAQGLVGLATGIGYPTLMGLSIRHVSDHERTAAMGLHQAVYGVGMFTGPFVAGFLSEQFGIQTTFLFLASAVSAGAGAADRRTGIAFRHCRPDGCRTLTPLVDPDPMRNSCWALTLCLWFGTPTPTASRVK